VTAFETAAARPGAPEPRGPGASPRRRLLAVVLWALAIAAGAVSIARTPFRADLSAFLPASPDKTQRLLIEQLQDGIASRTLMVGIEGGDAARRAEAAKALARTLRADARFEQVHDGERDDWQSAGDFLVAHRYQLSPAMAPGRFTEAGLRDAIGDTLSLLGTPAGVAAGALLDRDPTGETTRIAEGLIPANSPRMDHGVWVSRTAPRALLLLTTRASGGDLDAQALDIAAVRQAFAAVNVAVNVAMSGPASGPASTAAATPQARPLSLVVSGTPVFAVESRARIEHEATVLAIAGLVAVGLLLAIAFASVRALAVAMLPVGTGVVAGIATVGLVFGSVHGLTLGFGSTLIGEGVDYAIYFLMQAQAGGWRAWKRDSWPTVRLGLLTSVFGFSVLFFSGFPGLAQLGVFSVAGLIGAALSTRFVLPAIVPDGAPGRGLRQRLGRAARIALAHLPRARTPLRVAAVVVALVLVAMGGRLWRGDLSSLSPVPRAAQDIDAALREDLGASDARTMVVASGNDLPATLAAAGAASARLDALVDQGAIAGFDTPTRLLPDEAAQRARAAMLPDAATLRARLALATAGGPLNAARLEPFVQDVQAARTAPPVTREALSATPLKHVIDAMLVERKGGGWLALLPLQAGPKPMEAASLRAAFDELPAAVAANIQVIDIKQSLDELYARYLHEALVEGLLGALAVVAIVAVQLRSLRRVIAVCEPLAMAVVFTLGGLAAFGVALGILHLVGLLLVVAVGSNYGLFFDALRQAGRADDDDTLASLALANLTAVIGFGLIALSHIPALSAIGRVVAPGAALALLLSAACAGAAMPRPAAQAR
jgi:predicted exporter